MVAAGVVAHVVAALGTSEGRIATANMQAAGGHNASTLAIAHLAIVRLGQADGLRAITALKIKVAIAVLTCGFSTIGSHTHALTSIAAVVGALLNLATIARVAGIACTSTVQLAHAVSTAALGARVHAAILAGKVVITLAQTIGLTHSLSIAVVQTGTLRAAGTSETGLAHTCTLDAVTNARAGHGLGEGGSQQRQTGGARLVGTIRKTKARFAHTFAGDTLALTRRLAAIVGANGSLTVLASVTTTTILITNGARAAAIGLVAHADVGAVVRALTDSAVRSSPNG